MIHAQAIIDPCAKIGTTVEVGPFTVIGAEVEIGEGSWIGPHVVINGPTRIGRGNRIYQFSSIGEIAQDLKYAGERAVLEIGDRNVFREYCTVNRGTGGGGGTTRIGSDNLFMAYVHIAHDCQVGNHAILANVASLAGHVILEDYVTLGGFTGIHQFCRVGAYCMTGAGTVAYQDIPPFVTAAGNGARPYGINSTGLKRHGFSADALVGIKRAYKLLYKAGLRLEVAIPELRKLAATYPEVARLADFVSQEGRGIIR